MDKTDDFFCKNSVSAESLKEINTVHYLLILRTKHMHNTFAKRVPRRARQKRLKACAL